MDARDEHFTGRHQASPGILVAEYQFDGVSHSNFNLGLIIAALRASSSVIFASSREHWNWVSKESDDWKNHTPPCWYPLRELPKLRQIGRLGRVRAEIASYINLLRLAARSGAPVLVLCSTTKTGLVLSKLLSGLFARRTSTFIVMHELSELLVKPRGLLGQLRHLGFALRLPSPRNVKLIVPAKAVYRNLNKTSSRFRARLVSMDLPYPVPNGVLPTPVPSATRDQTTVFGFFGGGRPGRLTPFADLASRVVTSCPNAEFSLVGYLKCDPTEIGAAPIQGLTTRPLERQEFRRRAERVHYSLWYGPPEDYRLRLSATLLDSIVHLTPFIALRADLPDYYVERFGDIGYLCDSIEEMASLVEAIARRFPAKRYSSQCARLNDARNSLDPEHESSRLVQLLRQHVPPQERSSVAR